MSIREKKISKARHTAQCEICRHEKLTDIELDYLHCIPFRVIEDRYGIVDTSLMRHARALGLEHKRNRSSFYWRIIENAPFDKITAGDAINAAKQLDRLEGKLKENPVPSNIQVIYSSDLLNSAVKRNVTNNDR